MVRAEAYGSQVINGVLTQAHQPECDLKTHPFLSPPFPECILGEDILGNWPDTHICFLTYELRVIYERRTRDGGLGPHHPH